MKIRCIIGLAAFAANLTCSGAWAWDQDPAAQYFERKDTIVSGAGDAREVNAATHIIDPWPPYVGNRQIPTGSGCGVERYRTNRPWATSDCADRSPVRGRMRRTGGAHRDQSVGAAATGAAPAGTGVVIGPR